MPRHGVKHFNYSTSWWHLRGWVFFTFYKGGKWGTERLNCLPKITQSGWKLCWPHFRLYCWPAKGAKFVWELTQMVSQSALEPKSGWLQNWALTPSCLFSQLSSHTAFSSLSASLESKRSSNYFSPRPLDLPFSLPLGGKRFSFLVSYSLLQTKFPINLRCPWACLLWRSYLLSSIGHWTAQKFQQFALPNYISQTAILTWKENKNPMSNHVAPILGLEKSGH